MHKNGTDSVIGAEVFQKDCKENTDQHIKLLAHPDAWQISIYGVVPTCQSLSLFFKVNLHMKLLHSVILGLHVSLSREIISSARTVKSRKKCAICLLQHSSTGSPNTPSSI